MGGALSFLAGQEADVDAIAPFYGTPDPKLAKVPRHLPWPAKAASAAVLCAVTSCALPPLNPVVPMFASVQGKPEPDHQVHS